MWRNFPSCELSQCASWKLAPLYCFLLSTFLLSSCANHHFRTPAEGPPSDAPRYVELLADEQVGTLHFPTGTYSFYAVDDTGYYYLAPRKIVQHTGGSSVLHKGGIFLNKHHRNKLRGYIFYAGALTHVGDLSSAPHQFHD
jgi:hypothetical protein